MKSLVYLPLAALAMMMIMASCSSTRTTSTAGYEDDEIYYRRGDTFITEVPPARSSSSAEVPEDDYYTPSQSGGVTNNYYGDVYYNNSPGGFGGNFQVRPRWVMTWNPWIGWHMSYNFGMGNCWGNQWNTFYDPYYSWGMNAGMGMNSWGNPMWNNPYCTMGGMGYWNPYGYWNNPYSPGWGWYNSPWWGTGGWGEVHNAPAVVFGHRSPIASQSAFSSSYDAGTIYQDRQRKPLLLNEDAPVASNTERVASQSTSRSRFPFVAPESPSRPSGDPTMRQPHVRDEYFNPGARDRNPLPAPTRVTPSVPVSPGRETPSTIPSVTKPADRGVRERTPARDTGRQGGGFTTPSTSPGSSPSPGRVSPPSSSPSPSPGRSAGGGGRR